MIRRKNIEFLHELRLFIVQVIIPSSLVLVTAYQNPDLRVKIDRGFAKIKNKFRQVFHKK